MSMLPRSVHRTAASVFTLAMLLSVGCSKSAPPAASPAATPAASTAAAPTVVAAKDPFFQMYKSARSWAADAEPIRVSQRDLPGYKNDAGKAGEWDVVFASPSLHQSRIYTYAIADVPPGIFKGITAGVPDDWTGETRDAMAIDLTLFNVDSDAAFQAASAAATDWLKKNPTKELTALELGQTAKIPDPVWYTQWGNRTSGGYSVLVDAATGKVLNHK